jgi:hypothetical protein
VKLPRLTEIKNVLLELIRKRWYRWLFVGAIAFACAGVFLFCFNPIKYSAHTSIYIASSEEWSKFIGLARTRIIATRTEKKVNLQKRLSFKTNDEAVDYIMKGTTVNDIGKEGIINFSFTMPGPPMIAKGAGEKRKDVMRIVAEVTNAYVLAFREYLNENTVDGDTLRLQHMYVELERAKKDYNKSVKNLADFIRTHKMPMGYSPDMYFTTDYAAAKGIEKNKAPESQGEIQSLYASQKAIEAEIAALKANDNARRNTTVAMLSRLRTLPSEDALLMEARNNANNARVHYETLAKQLGPEHAQAVVAKDKWEAAEAELKAQVSAIMQRNTSTDASVRAQLAYLAKKYETVKRQIGESEADSHKSYQTMVALEKMRSDVALNLDILKVLSTQVASLGLQRLSATDRMHLLDAAEIPDSGSPGPKILIIFATLIAVFAILMAIMVDWLRMTYKAYRIAQEMSEAEKKAEEEAEKARKLALIATEEEASEINEEKKAA